MPSKRETQGARRTNYDRPTLAALITGRQRQQCRQGRRSIYRDPHFTTSQTRTSHFNPAPLNSRQFPANFRHLSLHGSLPLIPIPRLLHVATTRLKDTVMIADFSNLKLYNKIPMKIPTYDRFVYNRTSTRTKHRSSNYGANAFRTSSSK